MHRCSGGQKGTFELMMGVFDMTTNSCRETRGKTVMDKDQYLTANVKGSEAAAVD